MGAKSQRKGADGERELAALLHQYGHEVRRGGSLSYGSLPDLYGLPGVHIEVKRVERLNLRGNETGGAGRRALQRWLSGGISPAQPGGLAGHHEVSGLDAALFRRSSEVR